MVEEKKKVAIACQGGGSHTAFTAGVLKKLLKEKDGKYDIVALSGTSGGAICALLAWYGMLKVKGSSDKAIELLDSFWKENSATTPGDWLLNEYVVGASRMQDTVAMPQPTPYLYPPLAQGYLKSLLENLVRFDEVRGFRRPRIELFVGAVDALSGEFHVFKNSKVTADAILASAAIPNFFWGIPINGRVYWDGLFSQNPPIREFVDEAEVKPDEIWVIQINPETRKDIPVSMREIRDRRNELSGNLSLNQELYFIGKVNEWVRKGYLPDKYKTIKTRCIKMLYDLDTDSKLDRSPSFIEYMMDYGEKQAEEFLKHMPSECYPSVGKNRLISE